jgi:hypothetical protein
MSRDKQREDWAKEVHQHYADVEAAAEAAKVAKKGGKENERQASTSQMDEIWQAVLPMLPHTDQTNGTPFFVHNRTKIDMEDARELFHLFDENMDQTMDRREMFEIIRAIGVEEKRIDYVLDVMFEVRSILYCMYIVCAIRCVSCVLRCAHLCHTIQLTSLPQHTTEVSWEVFSLYLQRQNLLVRYVSPMEQIYLTFEDPSSSICSQYYMNFVVFCISVSALCYMLETWPALKEAPCFGCEPQLKYKSEFAWIEFLIIIAFTLDYSVRLGTASHNKEVYFTKKFDMIKHYTSFGVLRKKNNKAFEQRIENAKNNIRKASHDRFTVFRWITNPMNMIDLLSILPWYLEQVLEIAGSSEHSTMLQMLKMCRLFRLFKLKKYYFVFDVFLQTLCKSIEAIAVLVLVVILMLVFLGSMVSPFDPLPLRPFIYSCCNFRPLY